MNHTPTKLGIGTREQTIAQRLTDGKVEYLDYDFRARLARRGGKPFDLAVAEQNLLTLKAVFDRHGIKFWLVFGTCLGAVRDGGFIPHDTDTDVAVFAHEKDKVLAAMPDLIAAGLLPVRTKRPDDLLTFMREDEYIDIGFFGRHRDAENIEYWSYQNNRVYGDHFDQFEPVAFLGQTFLVPQRPEAYLTTLYGAGWKSPVKNLPAKEPQSQREFRPFSDLLVLADFFRDMPGYVVLKLSEHFPHYHDYSDIDILCADPAAVLAHIQQVGRAYQRRGFTLNLDESNGHLHLDFHAPGAERLNFRFDLLSGLDVYRKLAVSPDFAPAILAGRIKTIQHGAEVYVPAVPHDLALRFLEFIEWKDERPDKVKHWVHIEKTGNYAFVDLVNRFTDLQVDLTREAGAVQLTWARRPKPALTPGMAPNPPAPDEEQLNTALMLCNDCLNRQDFPAARQALDRAIELSPNNAGIRVHRGRLALLLNDEARAAQDFAAALRLDPRCAAAHAGVARLFFRCQQLPEAEQAADRALGLDAAEEEALQVKAECAAQRAAPRAGATNDYYPVAASCPIPEAGDLYEKFFSRRTNGTFVACGPAPDGTDSLTQVLADMGWKGCRVGPDDCRVPADGTNPLRQALSTRQVEPGFELLCVTADSGGCSLLASAELNYWRPQLVMLGRSGDDPADDAYPAQYFQEHQYLPVHQHGQYSVYAAREKLLAGRSRMDCFLIWGHGIPHWENILDRIRARSALEIVAIHRRPTGDMTQFVQDLYACDTVPFEHLRAKTRYLLATPAEVVFILVRNHNTQEKYYGEGAFRHIQCALIKDVKEEVRNAWNPRVDGRRSEDHVIHATDYESQVVHTLKVLGLPPLTSYQRQPNRAYDLPHHLAPIANCREVELPLEQIYARILGLGIVPLDQTPQYRYVAGEREPYLQYFARHFGKELTDDHSAAAFDRLIKEFDYGRPGRNGKPSLLVVSRQPGGYLLHDGVHRAAILKHRNVSRVRVLELLAEDAKPEMPGLERTTPDAAGPAGEAPAFQLALREGEQLVRQGRLPEARARLESALKLAPTPECAARAEEILTLLPGGATSAKAGAPVVVKLMGGLGNQMFQYAAGLALARKNQAPLRLDLTFLQERTPRPDITPRQYALDMFPLHPGCELITDAAAVPAGLKRIAERHFHYDPAVTELPAGVHLEGYWQSPRYFEPIETELRQHFTLAPQLGAAATALAERIKATEAVCLHVRRGDMVHDARTASVHGSCAVAYYRTACDVIARQVPAAHFFIFSDDPHWCESQDLTRGRTHTVVSEDGAAGDPRVDLCLMRLCRHFITANSTFSWWAAFLGGAAGKTVIVPDPWFTDPSMDISDLFPQDWIRLSRNPGPVLPDLTPAPAVSVIVPCYKQAHYLPEAVASVMGQAFADWELIVVNDGSPDDTSRVARDLMARHPDRRIRLLEKPNGGLADARNAGIREARGRLILPLDADDKLHPHMLQKTVALLKAQPRVAIVYTDLARFGAVTDVVALPEYDFKKLVHQNQLNCCSLFRREAWAAVGGYNPNMKLGYEDWDFWIGCGEKGFFGRRLPEPLFFYRVKNTSMFTKALEHHQALHAQIIANHPRLYDEPTQRRAAGILAQPAAGQSAPTASAPADALRGKRILVYTDDPGQGGAAHYNHALLLALVEAGAQAAIAQPQGDSPLALEQAKNGVQHCWTAYNPVVDFGRSFVDEDDARRIFELARPDLVFFSDCCAFSHLAAKKTALARDIPFVVICHSEATYLAERFAQFLPIVQAQLARARAVIGVSQSSLGVMRQHFGLAADKGQVIYNGCAESYFAPVDPAVRARLRADLRLPDNAVLCFTAARLDAGKCHQLQLEAIRRLRDSGRLGALHFAWAGDGDLRAQLEQQVKALQLEDRVHLLGYRWDVRDLMGAADIFVLTTLYEAMPLCILEAMARGLPVLASAVGGIPEALGETGILLPDPNLDPQKTIAALLDSLVSLAAAAPRRQAMRTAGKARAQELFSARRMIRATLDVMRRALADQAAAADEFFDVDEVRAIEQLCTAYAGNPADAAVSGQLQSLQQGLMNFLVTAPVGQLESQFKGSLGLVFRALVRSGLPSAPPTEEARAQLAVLDEALAGPPDPAKGFDCRPLLARMLRAPAHRGSTDIAPEKIPAWLLDDYLGYVLTAPQVFVAPGEAEDYHTHLLSWARTVQQRIRQAPGAAASKHLATVFATRANCIPLYSSRENLREFAQVRAAILEFVLVKNGAAIDAKLPRRPRHRPRIKVGFLCAHFGAQTETHVTLPALQLDREKFEVCLFPVAANPGPVETYCRSFADSFTPLPADIHAQVKLIRAAALDVLIIGTNITAVTNQVALIALHRLAPVQLATYCSPASTGLRHIDGYLTGTHLDIPGLQEHFSEKLRFCEGPPGCLDYTVERPGSAAPLTRAGLGLAADEVVFINAAACFKILPELQETWAKILQAVPNSRLLLLPFNPNWANEFPVKQFERTLAEACARHGVGRDRFLLAGSLPARADVKALERLADVYLDTFPFSGSISVIDPLELGLPTVVGAGPTARSRAAAALLQELGLPELITPDEPAYIALAVKLGTDPAYRRQCHDRILAAMARKPRFINPPAYARGLGELLESLVTGKKRPAEALALA